MWVMCFRTTYMFIIYAIRLQINSNPSYAGYDTFYDNGRFARDWPSLLLLPIATRCLMELPKGLEPSTPALQVRCSTN